MSTCEPSIRAGAGRLDLLTANEVRRWLAIAVADGSPRLIVDLGQVVFVDSTGLVALVGGLREARQAGGDLRLAGAPDQARDLFARTSLDRVFRLYRSIDDALVGL